MIKRIIPFVALMLSGAAFAQIGIGTKKAAAAAQLDVVASNKGVLLPRLTLNGLTDRTSIEGEMVESLLVYHLGIPTMEAGFYYWKDNSWTPLLSGTTFVDRKNNTFVLGMDTVTNEESLIITDTQGHSVSLAVKDIANNTTFVTNLTENQEFITKLGDNVEFIEHITNNSEFINKITENNEFIENIINELTGKYGNVGYDVASASFFYYDDEYNEVAISWDVLGNTKIKSFVATTEFLTITDTDDVAFQVSMDTLGEIMAKNDVFVTNLTKNEKFITELTENAEFVTNITNNNEFIDNIIKELTGKYGNVGYDVASASFFYYDDEYNEIAISWDVLGNTKIKSFVATTEFLTITDTDDVAFQVSMDTLGEIMAKNDVFVTNLTKNEKFITELTENAEFVTKITNNNEFIENIIKELTGKYGNVGYDVTSASFFYYDEEYNEVAISWDVLGNTKIKSFVATTEFLTITDTDDVEFQVSMDVLGEIMAKNEVFVTNLAENSEFVTHLAQNNEFVTKLGDNQVFKTIVNEATSAAIVDYTYDETIKEEKWLGTNKKIAQRVWDITLAEKTNEVLINEVLNEVILQVRLINKATNAINEGIVSKEIIGSQTLITIGVANSLTTVYPEGSYYLILEYIK